MASCLLALERTLQIVLALIGLICLHDLYLRNESEVPNRQFLPKPESYELAQADSAMRKVLVATPRSENLSPKWQEIIKDLYANPEQDSTQAPPQAADFTIYLLTDMRTSLTNLPDDLRILPVIDQHPEAGYIGEKGLLKIQQQNFDLIVTEKGDGRGIQIAQTLNIPLVEITGLHGRPKTLPSQASYSSPEVLSEADMKPSWWGSVKQRSFALVKDFFTAHSTQSLTVGFGFEGLRDTVHRADDQINVYPLTRSLSRHRPADPTQQLDSQIEEFLNNHNSTIVVSPSLLGSKNWSKMLDLSRNHADLNFTFIVSPAYVEEVPTGQNVMPVHTSTDLGELLKHESVGLYVTAGYADEIMHSLYYGVPLLLFANNGQQRALASRVDKVGVGQLANTDLSALATQAKTILKDGSMQAHLAEAVEELLALEEVKGDSLRAVISKALKYGVRHLINPNSGRSIRVAYDLDLKALILVFVIALLHTFRALLASFCKRQAVVQTSDKQTKPQISEKEPKPQIAKPEEPLAKKVYKQVTKKNQ